jgi:hypothetical protein
MPFVDREMIFGMGSVYVPIVEALTGQPNGRAKIDRLNTILRAAAVPSPALIARDSTYAWVGGKYHYWVNQLIDGMAKVGTPAAPITAHHWLNRPSRDSATLQLNDGTIRVIEIAGTGCAGCVFAMYALERFRVRFPKVEPVLLTFAGGAWGNRLIEPEDEVQRLNEWVTNNVKAKYPIGIWGNKKSLNEDGGMTLEPITIGNDYPIIGKPMLYVVDGKGILRRIFTGYDHEIEQRIAATIQFLQREANAQ